MDGGQQSEKLVFEKIQFLSICTLRPKRERAMGQKTQIFLGWMVSGGFRFHKVENFTYYIWRETDRFLVDVFEGDDILSILVSHLDKQNYFLGDLNGK